MHPEHRTIRYLLLHDKLSDLYLTTGIRNFGLSMIRIFLAIFVFTLRGSLLDVIIFLAATYLGLVVFFPVAGKLSARIGNAHTMLFSTPFIVLFFLVLYYFNPLEIGLHWIGLLYGMGEAFFWMAFHEEFAILAKVKKVGKEIGIVKIVSLSTSVAAPLIGGAIIAFFGFEFLFAIVIILLIVAIIPLLLSKDIKPRSYDFKFKEIFSRHHKPLFIPFVGYGASHLSTAWLWPILLFVLVPSFLEVGGLATISCFLTVVVTIIVGYKLDKINKKKIMRVGAVLVSIGTIARALVRTFFQAFVAWSFAGLVWPILDLPFEAITYTKSKQYNKLEFFVARELALGVGRFIILGIAFLAIMFFNTTTALTISIFVGGIMTLLYWKS
jgi:MFS transporter, YQGE family, putative transporter